MSPRLAPLLALALCACPAKSDDPARLYNAFALREAARTGQSLSGLDPRGAVALRGQPIPWLSPPYESAATLQRPDLDGLVVSPSFVEGRPASYLTTEVWYDYGPIWVQPLYVIVTAWDAAAPFSHALPGALPIFAVGADSSFYSPYWQVYYAVAPPGTKADAFKSARDVLDARLELHEGPNKICSLVPDDVDVASGEHDAPRRPLDGEPVGKVRRGRAWVDGKQFAVLDFGADRLRADAHQVVEETPLFHFTVRDLDGSQKAAGLPSVGGVGPLYSGRATDAPGGVPRFGALWRLYFVELPASAGAFAPADAARLRQRLAEDGVPAPPVDPAVAARPDAKEYLLRVALDPSCFADPARFPGDCRWLDSQAAIEHELRQNALHASDFTVTCPLLSYLGAPVPN